MDREVDCRYSPVYIDASSLIQKMRFTLRALDYRIDSDFGYLKTSNGNIQVEFFHKDEEILNLMKELVVKFDMAPVPSSKKRKVNVEIDYFYFSKTVAKEKGFSFDFLFNGIVDPGMSKGSLSGGALSFNFGNLTNHWFGLNIKYANSRGFLSHRETLKFSTYEGESLGRGEKTIYYRDGSTDVKQEEANKSISAFVDIDPQDASKVYLRGFKSNFPMAINDSFSILKNQWSQVRFLTVESGRYHPFEEKEVLTKSVSKDGKILGSSSSKLNTSFKWIASIKVTVEDREKKEEGILYDSFSKSFYYADSATKDWTSFAQSMSEIFNQNNIEKSVYRSPFGDIGNGFYFQFKPENVSAELLKLPMKFEVYGKGIHSVRQVRLENFLAGPLYVSDFDASTVKEKIAAGGVIPLGLRILIPDELKNMAKDRGLSEEVVDFFMYYYPSSGDLLIHDYKAYNQKPKKDLEDLIKIKKSKRRLRR